MPLQQVLDALDDAADAMDGHIRTDPNPPGPLQQNGSAAKDKADDVRSNAEGALLDLPAPSSGLTAASGNARQQSGQIRGWASRAASTGTSSQDKADYCERCRISIDGVGHIKDMIDNGP